MTEEQHPHHHIDDAELEAMAGGLGHLALLGDAGLIIDTSLNNVGNVSLDLSIDASTTIAGSFNAEVLRSRYRSGLPL